MTLAEMADFVCGKVRQTDTASIAKCKSYLARRYGMIYNQELWKDSLWAYDFTFDTTDLSTDPVNIIYNTLPFGNVYAVRRGAWLFPAAVDKVVSVRASNNPIPVTSEQEFYKQDLDAYALTGPATNFIQMPKIVAYADSVSDTNDDSTELLGDTAADHNLNVTCEFLDHEGELQSTTGRMSGFHVGAVRVLLKVTKDESTGGAYLNNSDSDVPWYRIGSNASEPLRCRIRFAPSPQETTAFKALVKLKAQSMTDDAEEPQISGIEDCLMAFVQGDMLQRARQYGKAQVVSQEALALLSQLKIAGVAQEAHDQRITPEVVETSGTIEEANGKGWW